MNVKLKNYFNHHPLQNAYMWSLATFIAINFGGSPSKWLANLCFACLTVIWILAERQAQLSAKKQNLSGFDNPYAEQISFKFSLYVNDILFTLLAWSNFSDHANYIPGICLLLIVVCSFIPFNYSDEEYEQMLQQESTHKSETAELDSSVGPSNITTPPYIPSSLNSMPSKLQQGAGTKSHYNDFVNQHPVSFSKPVSNQYTADKILDIDVAGTKYNDLKKAVAYARTNDLLFFRYDNLTVSEIKEDLYTDDDPLYETDLTEAIDEITLEPEIGNNYDPNAIRVILHIAQQRFMIGYIPKQSATEVWELLSSVDKGLLTIKVNGYMSGGKYKAVDLDDHIYTKENPYEFSLTIKAFKTNLSKHREGEAKNGSSLAKLPLKIHKLRRPLHSFVAVDIETTGLTPPFDKVIQIAAAKYIDDQLVDTFCSYVNPGNDKLPLSKFTTNLTGISTQDVENAPYLREIKDKFIEFVDALPWVGHYIFGFDIPFLYQSGIGISEFSAEDTLSMARRKLNSTVLGNLKLPTLKRYYNVDGPSHDALADCKTVAAVYKHLRDDSTETMLITEAEKNCSLDGFHFLVIGDFPELSHDQIVRQIELRGGVVDQRWSTRTQYLVNGITKKEYKSVQKAKEHNVKFLNFTEFINLVGNMDQASEPSNSIETDNAND